MTTGYTVFWETILLTPQTTPISSLYSILLASVCESDDIKIYDEKFRFLYDNDFTTIPGCSVSWKQFKTLLVNLLMNNLPRV